MRRTALVVLVFLAACGRDDRGFWQRQVLPGRLSSAHAFLENDCGACHGGDSGRAADANCVGCHAGNEALLQRQPTAFHATIANCARCHAEHLGREARLRVMNHQTLAAIGTQTLRSRPADDPQRRTVEELRRRANLPRGALLPDGRPHVTPAEMTLDCAGCHGTKDVHQSLFGSECAWCHGTSQWTIEQFDHPSPRSHECAQCHVAPPSHYMEHFTMVSKRVAGVDRAEVSQCYLCHQTTHWNDIKRVGWYKHH